MRTILKLCFALATALAITACSNAPVFHGMTTQQKEAYAKAIAGEYSGTCIIIYNDGTTEDNVVKTETMQMTITDQTLQAVLFHNYPVSLLSRVVTDPALAQALADVPNMDIAASYHFFDTQDNGDVNWSIEPAPIPLTLHYDGADHHIVLKLGNTGRYYQLTKANMDANTPLANQRVMQFDFIGIYEGDTLLQDLSSWSETDAEFYTFFQLAED